MNKLKSVKSWEKKSVAFKPTRKFIKTALEEYLNRGGRITKLNTGTSFYAMTPNQSQSSESNDFLTETYFSLHRVAD